MDREWAGRSCNTLKGWEVTGSGGVAIVFTILNPCWSNGGLIYLSEFMVKGAAYGFTTLNKWWSLYYSE
ncbi:hypothetical protein T07_1117 [Trichinella nelsoni]|uniref:Uncharacterized protein n=1 Tax=Trichinella nelsoni TaxID=6336 RepID=A0A0V0RIL3_9BILA|nr:hypothetical protein T07_1117 [Trichinella nelsoni]